MKTIKKRLVVVLFLLGTIFNYANDKESNMELMDAKKVRILFKNVTQGNFLIIKDTNDAELYTENIESSGDFSKVFDISAFVDGNYVVELHRDYKIVVKPFEVKLGKVVFHKTEEETIFKPIVRNENNLLLISKLSFDEEPLEIKIYYKDMLIHREVVKSDAIINKVYKLDTQKKGDYTVSLYNNDRNYLKEFKI